jgi:hypothetical protein
VGSTGVRQTELFGAPRAAPHRRTTTSTPRGAGRCSPPGQELGALRSLEPPSHRSKANGALRSLARSVPPGTGNRTSSEERHPVSTPARVPRLRGRAPQASRGRRAELFGALRSAPHWDRADGALRSFTGSVPRVRELAALRSHGPPSPPGARQPEFFGTSRAEPHRGQADGTLRRAARRASPGSGRRHSSEGRAPSLTGATHSALFGAS